jgi:hypothetical protein
MRALPLPSEKLLCLLLDCQLATVETALWANAVVKNR